MAANPDRWSQRGRRPIRVANCAGGLNDPGYQMRRPAEQGDVDFITGDWLAEVSLADNKDAMITGKHGGWIDSCWDGIRASLDILASKSVKLIINGGGLNPAGLARETQKLVVEKGFKLRVAYISGDDLLDEVRQGLEKNGSIPGHLDSINPEIRLPNNATALMDTENHPLLAANAYLGARGIVKALDAGADIIICGRVSDASPVLGAAWWWYQWQDSDYDELANALIAGHLIECSGYVTGGNFSGFDQFSLEQLIDIPFGIAEISSDGTSEITMNDTGRGRVTVDTVKCQFLYELQGPIYLNSDVAADATNVKIVETGKDRVKVTGIRGSPPPATTKLAIFYKGGYQCQLLINATGYDTEKKWNLFEKQVRYVLQQRGVLDQFDVLDFQVVGEPQANPASQLKSTTYCRVFAQASNESVCASLKPAWAEFIMQHFSGLHFSFDFRTTIPQPYIAYYPGICSQEQLSENANILAYDGTMAKSIDAGHPLSFAPISRRINFDTAEPWDVSSTLHTRSVRLGDIALGRSGDKGANINLGIYPKDASHWTWFRSFMSRSKLQELMGQDWREEYVIERSEFPNINAVHFVIYGVLGRGSSSSRLLDNLGKGFCDFIRDKVIDIPQELLVHP